MLDGNSKSLFLGGFSQGCALSLASFMETEIGPLGGVMGLSGMYAYQKTLTEEQLRTKKETPIMIYHGESDPMVPWIHA